MHQADHWFTTTHWSLVLQAGAGSQPESRQARETLCRTYWPPLYAYVRRCGRSAADSEDLVQSFFLYFLSRDLIEVHGGYLRIHI